MKNIAVFPGSFFPFHKGHLDILQKADAIFDEVILAIGVNSKKDRPINPENGLPIKKAETIGMQLEGFRIEEFEGFLTDYVASLEESGDNITIVRGIRNGKDLENEMEQLSVLKDLKPDIKTIFIPSDVKLSHVSSSMMRLLEKVQEGASSEYLAKYKKK